MADAPSMWSPPTLNLTVECYAAWKAWRARWEDYAVVTQLNTKDATYQCSMLRYIFSEETRKIYESLSLSEDDRKGHHKNHGSNVPKVEQDKHVFNRK